MGTAIPDKICLASTFVISVTSTYNRPISAVSDNRDPNTGALGEDLVAQWLQSQGWQILYRRWRCRWGEIDIIAQQSNAKSQPTLAFVEVKTRSRSNWDADGLLSINRQKRSKLLQTSEIFLADHPELADMTCRFDVALVCCQQLPRNPQKLFDLSQRSPARPPSTITIGLPVTIAGYHMVLKDYIASAFDE